MTLAKLFTDALYRRKKRIQRQSLSSGKMNREAQSIDPWPKDQSMLSSSILSYPILCYPIDERVVPPFVAPTKQPLIHSFIRRFFPPFIHSFIRAFI